MDKFIDIKVPDIGDVTDAEIIEIAVSAGDTIEVEDTLIVLETEKATMDVPSSTSGVIKEIVCRLGDMVSQGSVILKLDAKEDTPAAAEPDRPKEEANRPKEKADSQPVNEPEVSSGEEKPSPVAEDLTLHEPVSAGVVYASPAIRRFARELGVDLVAVNGSGTKGRILKEDVRQHVKNMLSKRGTDSAGSFAVAALPKVDFGKLQKPTTRLKSN